MTEKMDLCDSKIYKIAAFLEKYLPIILQRQLSQVLSHIFTDKKTLWWLKRFNGIKMPILTANLFIEAEDSMDSRQD
jgi:hypothetical protein